MGNQRRRRAAGAAAFLWMVLHFYTSVRTFFENFYYTYTGCSWVLLGIWLLGLLALDAQLASGEPKLLRFMKWYWALSAGVAATGLLTVMLDLSWGGGLAIGVLCSLLTPVNQLGAFSWLVFDKMAGLRGSFLFSALWSAMLLFCLIHFAYMAWLHRRANKRGETANGPVDLGARAMG